MTRFLALVAALTSCAPVHAQTEDFDMFLGRFCDADFRDDRTAWPLRDEHYDAEYEPTATVYQRGDRNYLFEMIDEYYCDGSVNAVSEAVYDNHEMVLADTGRRALVIRGRESDVSISLLFEARGGRWYLVGSPL